MVLIGKIIRTRGNKGELVVSLSPGAVAPEEGGAVELRSNKRAYPQTIQSISGVRGDVIVSFSGAHNIGEALRFVGCTLWAEVPPPVEESASDFLGFQVFDRNGECWGTIISQSRFSQSPILEVEDAEGKIVYVPWHESLVVTLDRCARSLVIDPPAGLRDLNK